MITLSEGKALERLGLAPGEMVGTSIFDYGELPELPEYARRALAGESFENRVRIGDGTLRLLLARPAGRLDDRDRDRRHRAPAAPRSGSPTSPSTTR